MPDREAIRRYQANLDDEIDGIAIYHLLAEAEPDPERRAIFEPLADVEPRHAHACRRNPPPPPRRRRERPPTETIAAGETWPRTGGGGPLRASIFGVSDGLVSNVSLIMGFAGAQTEGKFVLLAGVAGLLPRGPPRGGRG